jgi:hypothetical protein
MIPKEHETYLIQSALSFVRALSEAYGPDEGLKLWENMNANLDPDIKGKVFFAMISGEYDNVIKMTGVSTGYEKVRAIKCIRSYTGLGLKESKDICDWLEKGTYKSIEVPPMERSKAMSELRQCGVWL